MIGASKKSDSNYRQEDGKSGNPNEASWLRGGKRWVETVDPETNHVYYVCPATGESRITLPPPDHDNSGSTRVWAYYNNNFWTKTNITNSAVPDCTNTKTSEIKIFATKK